MKYLLGWGYAVGLMALEEMSCCGLVKSPLECPAGAEQLLDPIAVVGWPRELEVLSWELPCSAVTAAAAVPSVVLVLINVLN